MNESTELLREVQSLVSELLDERLDQPGQVRLNALLKESSAARAYYVAVTEIHAELHWRHDAVPQVWSEPVGTAAELSSSPEPARTEQRRSPLLGFLSRLPIAIQPAHHPYRFVTTTAVLTSLFWILVVLFIWPRGGREDQTGDRPAYTARITHLENVVWAEETATRFLAGSELPAGQELAVKAGLLQLHFGDGARVVVQGPVSLRIEDRGAMTLHSGKLLARVPGEGVGFTVKTPVVEVVDLGTEFGISAGEQETETHVFEGAIEVRSRAGARLISRRLTKDTAMLFGISPQDGFYVKEKEMNRAIYLSLAALLSLPIASETNAALVQTQIFSETFNTNAANLVATEAAYPAFSGFGNVSVTGNRLQIDATGAGNAFLTDQSFNEEIWVTADMGGSSVNPNGTYATALVIGNRAIQFFPGYSGGGFRIYPFDPTTGALGTQLTSPTDINMTYTPGTSTLHHVLVHSNNLGGLDVQITDGSNPSNVFSQSYSFPGFTAGKVGFSGLHGAATHQFDNLTISALREEVLPAPEPTAAALMGVGGMLVLGVTRAKRRKQVQATLPAKCEN